ncbi:MAG: histidine--tRNA ligase [Oscillospiraceae bacterium]|nr:histidine--tRNA ligase [Oscillospiraceae bacterium]
MKTELKVEPRTLAGFMELQPSEQILFNQMADKIRSSYERFGFLPLDTPILELSEVLLAKAGGETETQIYRFKKGNTDMSMRFDLTVPLAKYVAQNYGKLQFPFRRYQIGKVYRGESPQKGRFREFYQADIDIIGDGELSIVNDAEIPSIIYTTFRELGFDDFTIRINNRKILNGFFKSLNLVELSPEIMRIIDKLDKVGKEVVTQLLIEIGLSENSVYKIIEFISIIGTNSEKINSLKELGISDDLFLEGVKELEEIVTYIKLFGVPESNFMVDLTIARGLDYYTGTVYETILNDYKQIGSVCSGGRYDNLAEYYTNKPLPGVGISIGLTRLFYQLNELKSIKAEKTSISDVLVISASNDIAPCLPIANSFRNEGINTEVYSGNKKIGTKFKYADRLQIPFVAIIGEDEVKNGTVSLKNLSTGEQKELNISEAIQLLKKDTLLK